MEVRMFLPDFASPTDDTASSSSSSSGLSSPQCSSSSASSSCIRLTREYCVTLVIPFESRCIREKNRFVLRLQAATLTCRQWNPYLMIRIGEIIPNTSQKCLYGNKKSRGRKYYIFYNFAYWKLSTFLFCIEPLIYFSDWLIYAPYICNTKSCFVRSDPSEKCGYISKNDIFRIKYGFWNWTIVSRYI